MAHVPWPVESSLARLYWSFHDFLNIRLMKLGILGIAVTLPSVACSLLRVSLCMSGLWPAGKIKKIVQRDRKFGFMKNSETF